ncbi:hypothetical protein [Janthinobacterium sp. UMAB-56]|uniref:hypothetical protein n=1 Tax=Janthinobacterium sp. UMAB-56 TaxID=1365361 RepID=UPI001C55CB1D|nr:hypothetical protein [Janthinobacterium sp. UMAB-56]
MGRKSSLTDAQWIEVERRHLVDGISINALAQEFGVNESSIRRRIKPNKAEAPNAQKDLRVIAEKMVQADAANKQIAELFGTLPLGKQRIVSDLARKLSNISENVACSAELNASSMHRLSLMASQALERVDEVDPMSTPQHLTAMAALHKLANSAAEIPLKLLNANKDNEPPPPPQKTPEQVDRRLNELLAKAGG